MKKIDFKLIIVGIIGVLASYFAFPVSYFLGFAVFAVLSVFSLFIVNLVSTYGVRVFFVTLNVVTVYFASGAEYSVFAFLLFVVPAVFMAEIIRRSKDFSITLCGGAGVFVLGTVIADRVLIAPKVGGLRVLYSSYIDSFEKTFTGFNDAITKAYGDEIIGEMITIVKSTCYMMKLMFPGLVVIFSLAVVFCVLLMSRKLIANIPVPEFSFISAPKALAYTYFVCYLAGYFSMGSSFDFIVYNVSSVLSVVLLVCGLSLLRFYTKLIPSKLLSGIVFVFLIPLSISFSYILIVAGAVDALFGFRRLRNEKR